MPLRLVRDSEPGIHRERFRGGFRYRRENGTLVRDRHTLNRIRKLAVPPAWEAVWICAPDNGHIQATGRDARGRKQYRYHADWTARRGEEKFSRLNSFGRALPTIRRRVRADLAKPGLSRETVLAAVVHLLDRTHLRIGNEEYVRDNNSFGLTTLLNRHAVVTRRAVRVKFSGKSGVRHERTVTSRRLAKIVRGCRELPGQELFQYRNERGDAKAIGSADVNDYLREVSGGEFTAKDFRTWAGTVAAAAFLRDRPVPKSAAARKRAINEMLTKVSTELGNTPAICRKCYVHPRAVEAWIASVRPSTRAARGLNRDESYALRLIRSGK